MNAGGDNSPDQEMETRSGYVTLLGRPNAGKSTLLNRFIGERLSIVTPKAQTTWQRVTGIVTSQRAQMIFLDTPGLLEPRDLLQQAMLAAAEDALAGHEGVSYIIPQPRVVLDPLADQQLTMFAMMPRAGYTVPEDFNFAFTDSLTGVSQLVKVRFRGP